MHAQTGAVNIFCDENGHALMPVGGSICVITVLRVSFSFDIIYTGRVDHVVGFYKSDLIVFYVTYVINHKSNT